MKKFSLFVLVAFAISVSGCNNLRKSARVNPAAVVAYDDLQDPACELIAPLKEDLAWAINLDCFKFNPNDEMQATAYVQATQGEDAEEERVARNRLQAAILTHADLICEKEKAGIYSDRAVVGGVLDFLSSGFSISSTIVGGELSKSILGGLAGLSTATRTNIDANVYQNQLVTAITQAMDTERARLLTEMEALKSEQTDNYTADDMIRRTNEYHQACSFQKGVQLLAKAAADQEGSTRIIDSINYDSAVAALLSEMERIEGSLATEGMGSKRKQYLQDQLREFDRQISQYRLLQAQNARDTTSVLVTSRIEPADRAEVSDSTEDEPEAEETTN